MSKNSKLPVLDKDLLSPMVSFAVVNRQDDLAAWEAIAKGEGKGALYARNASNPAASSVEQRLCKLESADFVTSFSSGMAAISNVLFALLSPGKRVIVGKDTYGGASYLFSHALPQWGVEVDMLDTTDEQAFAQAISKGCDLLYLESPSNPLLKIQNIAKLSDMAHQQNGLVVIDNTLATPINQKPLLLGADVVLHSATKFIGGHADALGGIVCCKQGLSEQIKAHKEIHGACLDPMSAYLIDRGLRTLELRMERHNSNALALAQWLQQQSAVDAVNYPGLPSHSSHSLVKQQMSGYGGVLSFSLKQGEAAVEKVMNSFNIVNMASTLGSVETMVGTPATTSHVECTAEERRALGVPDGLIRCSVGIEAIADIIDDFEQAFSSLR